MLWLEQGVQMSTPTYTKMSTRMVSNAAVIPNLEQMNMASLCA